MTQAKKTHCECGNPISDPPKRDGVDKACDACHAIDGKLGSLGLGLGKR